ncbi:hypothetical protein DY000_02059001 [Brassica cretica]|uniref:Replication factor A C-terminal domain-containing protein n=1 Tax=Brassica cretica TaxID=69181 RepID=A0ABQ7AZE6_BRACR|nr:hypothetical protein DY000_02059001 [Brassica cretica]
MRVNPRVIVATNINPRTVGGRLFLNATYGTHIYFDEETSAGKTSFNRLVSISTGLPPAAPLLRKVAIVEPVTIAELNSFVTIAVSQDIEFMCTGRVIRLHSDKGWCYFGCSKCGRKLQRIDSTFRCVRCNNSHAVGDLRYRVELAIADDTAEGLFICLAGQMLADEVVYPEDSQMPPFVTSMEGKPYTFHVKLTTYDFTSTHQSFTVTSIIDEHERPPLPEFAVNEKGGNDGENVGDIQPIHVKVDSGGGSGATTLNAVKDPIGHVPKKMDIASTHALKKARIP